MRRGYAETEVGQIHYREAGQGEPVLLMHMTATSSIHFRHVLPLLAERGFRAIAMDTPGFGLSDPPPGPEAGIPHYAAAALGLLDDLGLERAHLAGLRTGASIALELAANHPERVDRVVLTGLLAMRSEEERQHWLTDGPAKHWEPDGRGEFLDTTVRDWIAYFAAEDDGEGYLLELIAALQAGPRFWWAYEAVVRLDAYERLRRLTRPTLFLNPTEDSQYESMRSAYEQAPSAEYREFPGVGTEPRGWVAVVARRPREYADAVAGFLARSRRPAPAGAG
jgi:pimeloyl-ACP methyl ester carboxylesterase